VLDCVCNCHHLQNHSKKFVLGGAWCGVREVENVEYGRVDFEQRGALKMQCVD